MCNHNLNQKRKRLPLPKDAKGKVIDVSSNPKSDLSSKSLVDVSSSSKGDSSVKKVKDKKDEEKNNEYDDFVSALDFDWIDSGPSVPRFDIILDGSKSLELHFDPEVNEDAEVSDELRTFKNKNEDVQVSEEIGDGQLDQLSMTRFLDHPRVQEQLELFMKNKEDSKDAGVDPNQVKVKYSYAIIPTLSANVSPIFSNNPLVVGEVSKSNAEVVDELIKNTQKELKRQRGGDEMRKVSYRDHDTCVVQETLQDNIRSPLIILNQQYEEDEVPGIGSIAKSENKVYELFDELIACNIEKLDENQTLIFLKDLMKIKPVDIQLPKFHEIPRVDFISPAKRGPIIKIIC
ncbi:hypothetical protein L1887_11393 [Cichorium endivia]|nr:hypothetical protein L1887_11393 [Cichorium endivia]